MIQIIDFIVSFFHMFSSGTTGAPKCIVHGHGGTLLNHLKEHKLQSDMKDGDRLFYFTGKSKRNQRKFSFEFFLSSSGFLDDVELGKTKANVEQFSSFIFYF